MLRLEFSEADKHALNHERYHHPHPRVQQRMEALGLKSQGLPHQRIATLCAISGNRHWFRLIPNAWDRENFCQG